MVRQPTGVWGFPFPRVAGVPLVTHIYRGHPLTPRRPSPSKWEMGWEIVDLGPSPTERKYPV